MCTINYFGSACLRPWQLYTHCLQLTINKKHANLNAFASNHKMHLPWVPTATKQMVTQVKEKSKIMDMNSCVFADDMKVFSTVDFD